MRPDWGLPLLLLAVASAVLAKESSRFVTAEMRANALANVKKYPWAAKAQRSAVAGAKPWLELSDDELWALVPSQEVPRSANSTFWRTDALGVGCPNCGKAINRFGTYPWVCDPWKARWKIKCPNCAQVYPKNDFEAFYKSALDEHGFFRRALGDRSLLFNAEHPDPKDPLHKVYVDDGYGMVDEKGVTHVPVAHYAWTGQWRNMVCKGLTALANAYKLTDDRRYAHKAAVLLDRIADVYPDMNYAPLAKLGFECSTGGSGRGRIEGNIWETFVTEAMASNYDAIFDGIQGDEELVQFLSAKSAQYKLGDKSSIAAICAHIEDHLLLEVLKSVKDGRIDGNTGMTHTCLATAAIALDRKGVSDEWMDWLFDPNYPVTDPTYPHRKDSVPWVLVEGLDRDGMGGECGGYGLIWSGRMMALADILTRCPVYTKRNVVREFPKLKQVFFIQPRLNCLDAAMPNIGDSGATGTWGRTGSPQNFALGFRLYHDPRLAALAWHYANAKPEALRLDGDIFTADPDVLIREIATLAKTEEDKLKCDHLGRYGLAYVQTETPENGRALWIHYGDSLGHSHADALNIGIYAKNIDMLPELGYPEYTGSWPKRHAWTAHTLSHNTVMINDAKSSKAGGKITLFAVQPPLRVMDVSSPKTYPGLSTYRRTVAMVDISGDDSYVLDVFRARGGKNHRLSYHGPSATVNVSGISLARQAKGTFAGENVEFAQFYDDKPGCGYKGSGFMYLYDVERSKPVTDGFTVDWKAEDNRGRITEGHEPHLRLHALTPCDEVALASGDPPQNKQGNPRRLRYLIQSRLGEKVESEFVTVLEPYDKTPFIKCVRKLRTEHSADANSVAAVVVELADGTSDVLISCEEPTRVTVEGGITFEGQFGMVRRLPDGQVKAMRMARGTRLAVGDTQITADAAAYVGKVKAVDASDPANNQVRLDPPLPGNAPLVGQTIHFRNDLPQDTSYEIKAVAPDGISTGDITVIHGFKDPKDFNQGYTYLVNPGDEYVVPSLVGLDR